MNPTFFNTKPYNFRKIFLSIFITTFFLLSPLQTQAQSTTTKDKTALQACQETIQEVVNLCKVCNVNRNQTVTFQGNKLNCQELTPILPSDSKAYFYEEVNCINYSQQKCVAENPVPQLKPFDSEFYNVTDNKTGILANPNSSFLTSSNSSGPILGPIYTVINLLVALIGTLTVLAIVLGGFLMVTARGDDNQITRGKDVIKNALIALVIVMTSYTLIRLTQALVFNLIN